MYRSDFLIMLYTYLEECQNEPNIQTTEIDIIGLFCSILNQRLLIIDDKEFVGERQSLTAKFLSLPQLKVICRLLNRVAFEVFSNEDSVQRHTKFLLENLSQVL